MYGQEFELISDPRFIGNNIVVVDAIEQKSRSQTRVSIPRPIVNMIEKELRLAA